MSRPMKTVFPVLFLLALAAKQVQPLNCYFCSSEKSWSDCQSQVQEAECTSFLVNALHSQLLVLNPSLPVMEPSGNVGFKCTEHHMRVDGEQAFMRACTYASVDVCAGWNPLLEVRTCESCTTDLCNSAVSRLALPLAALLGLVFLVTKL
ncbi:uncharacterized protein LOC129750858 [Uranotaenia lowii]|uniref:uncharacterized protein LOC129750858 n=1 Tax=Uranotaenia lowii TaxID=190385 RepID=UPI002479FBBA|nr:uncharacterized protein LOC129750858 [Uranotaenia lowii]